MVSLWEALGKAKEYRWVDLTHELENDSPYWSGIPSGSVELGKQVMDYAEMGFEIQTFKFPGQFGTHIDYPAHFVPGARRAAAFGLKETVLPLVVLDVSQKAASDRDYELTVQDVLEFEERYGRIPKGCFVALRTDWSKGWPSMEKLCGLDGEGNEHFPAWGYEALRFLYEERGIAANGHETLDTDAPVGAGAALRALRAGAGRLSGGGDVQPGPGAAGGGCDRGGRAADRLRQRPAGAGVRRLPGLTPSSLTPKGAARETRSSKLQKYKKGAMYHDDAQ